MASEMSGFGIDAEIDDASESKYIRGDITGKTMNDIDCIDDDNMRFDYNNNKRLTIMEDIFTILRGFRNGFIYGIRIRLPHAFVMTLLFYKDRTKIKEMAKIIFNKTKQHSSKVISILIYSDIWINIIISCFYI